MDNDRVPEFLEDGSHLVADEVVRKRDEGGRAVVHDHVGFGFGDEFNERVELAGIDFIAFEDVDPLDPERGEGVEGAVDGIGVDTEGGSALGDKRLSEQIGDERLANASLSLEDEMGVRHQKKSGLGLDQIGWIGGGVVGKAVRLGWSAGIGVILGCFLWRF